MSLFALLARFFQKVKFRLRNFHPEGKGNSLETDNVLSGRQAD